MLTTIAHESISHRFFVGPLPPEMSKLRGNLIYFYISLAYMAWLSTAELSIGVKPKTGVGFHVAFLYLRANIPTVRYQDQVIKRVKIGIQEITDPRGHQLTRRPFQATWFSNQLSMCVLSIFGAFIFYVFLLYLSCLMLFHHDRALIAALELAKSIVIPIDVMNVLWPCSRKFVDCLALSAWF